VYERAVPILPVRDLERALAFYASLGFDVRAYDGGGYGFATRDGAEIHLGWEAEPHRTSAYLRVADADAVAAEWRAAGADVHGPQDTEWRQHEGALVDPDGNVIRFGSPIQRPS
jgi:catechol 2,3-dioxygenase-like lactoylglutathione lyase family enzyme